MELTWKNVLNTNLTSYPRIDVAGHYARLLGYPYILWNDRIYRVLDEDRNYIYSTVYTITDVK